MRPRSRLRLAVLGAAVSVVAPLGFVALSATPTLAASNFAAPYVTTANGSDPDAEPCTYGGQTGYCLFTSQDLNQGLDSHGNYYPMNQTMAYFSADGLNWTSEGAVLNESAYVSRGWTPSGANHLWAPQWAENPKNSYNYLYVPDVSNLGSESTSSYIGVSYALPGHTFGPYHADVQLHGDPNVHGGYASDPNVFKDSNGNLYMDYANGDASNCGGISIAPMSNYVTMGTSQAISLVNGSAPGAPQISELGGCNVGSTHYAMPYMEGPSIYYTPSWNEGALTGTLPGPYLMVFAAKPLDSAAVPPECSGGGQPNTHYEVIAYATSFNPTGPYTYQGILMCGSAQEWTNQASLMPMRASSGDMAIAMIYHDASTPGGPPQGRTLHGECLFWGGGLSGNTFAGTTRTNGSYFSDGGLYKCLNNFNPYAVVLKSQVNGRLVSAQFSGGYPTGELVANRQMTGGPGSWEWFEFYSYNSTPLPARYELTARNAIPVAGLQSQKNFDWVSSYSNTSPLQANSSSYGIDQEYALQFDADGTVRFSAYTNQGVATQSDGSLVANGSTQVLYQEEFDLLHY